MGPPGSILNFVFVMRIEFQLYKSPQLLIQFGSDCKTRKQRLLLSKLQQLMFIYAIEVVHQVLCGLNARLII